MESNKDEARGAMDTAEKKLSENDYVGAKKFINMAQNLYPELDGLEQVSMMINVYISASKNVKGGESDWYGILGVNPLADEETVKKQYKKLALLLHPDKNKRNGAEEAFKLVSEAWCLLSDKAKRVDYDQERKPKKTGMQKPPKPYKPASSTNVNRNAKDWEPKPPPADTRTFWTMCNGCKTQCSLSYLRLNKIIPCPNCSLSFIAIPKSLWLIHEEQKSAQHKARNRNKKAGYSSWKNRSSSAQKTPQESAKGQERSKRAFEEESQERTIRKKQRICV